MKMTYTDVGFMFCFLPIVVILYNIFPKKLRGPILLIASYVYFWILSEKLIAFLIASTLITYIAGLIISKVQNKRDEVLKTAEKEAKKQIKEKYNKRQRIIAVIFSLTVLAILVVLKYSKFFCTNINEFLDFIKSPFNIPIPKFLLPIGISFYTLQAISYIVDVYKGKYKADKNIGRVSLFLAFFPQIMEGPICRYDQTAEKLWSGQRSTYKGLTFGSQRILLGLMKKYVVVDRVNPLIIEIFKNYGNYDGGIVAVGMILYTMQLYMDFSGTMDIVIGIAEMFGVTMSENFKQPFFSKTISEFWTRWHITLGAFFRDYIYYPVSLTKKCKNLTSAGRKKLGNYYGPMLASTIALFCVWICNGLWHGSAWSFIFFGMYHFTIIVIERLIEPGVKKIHAKLKINSEKFAYRLFQIIKTTILVFIGELFFRAEGLRNGLAMFWQMITKFSFKYFADGTIFKLGVDEKDFIVMGVVVFLVFIIGLFKEKGINVRQWIANRNIVLRWAIYYALIISIIVFGCYGFGVTPLDPMYANF